MKKHVLFKPILMLFLALLTLSDWQVQAQTFAEIGSGTDVNLTTAVAPVNINWRRRVIQMVYTQAELNTAGVPVNGIIDQLGWFVTQAPIYDIPDYTVKIKHVSASDASVSLGLTGWTEVKNGFTYMPTAGGWDMLAFDQNFVWNGTDNLAIEICWSQIQPTFNASGQQRMDAITNGMIHNQTDAAGNSCGVNPATLANFRPHVRFRFTPSSDCAGMPNAGSANATPVLTCQNSTTNLSLSGATIANGIAYQWYESSDDVTYTIIAGATSNVHAANVNFSGSNYYRCQLTCTNSSQSATSASILVTGNSQLSGTYTINNLNPTGGTNFNNFQDAFAALACGASGPVTFNVSDGQTFSSTGALVANFTGTPAAPITFQKAGAGTNPSISFTGTSGTADAGLQFIGSDYITWNGIDILQGGTSTTDWIEYAIDIRKASASDGASNNTFSNFSIDLGASTATTLRGIFMQNDVASTSPDGASSNNMFQNLTITNVTSAGIWLAGGITAGNQDNGNFISNCNISHKSSTATAYGIYLTHQDNCLVLNNTLGNYSTTGGSHYPIYVTGAVTTTNVIINGNTIENITNSGTGLIYGIYTLNGGSFGIAQNTIRNLSTGGTIRGIYLNAAAATVSDVNENRIYGINSTTTTTNYASGIHSAFGVNRIYNNMITGITANTSTMSTTAAGANGINVTGGTSYEIYNNTVILSAAGNRSAAFAWSTTTPTFDIRNNIFVNNGTSSVYNAALYRSTAGNPNFEATSGNNLYYAGTPSATNPIYRNGANSVEDLASYLGISPEPVAYTEDLQYTLTNGEVAIDQNTATYVESNGQDIPTVAVDYYGTARGPYPLAGQQVNGGTSTDIGAEENDFLKNIPAVAPDCATLDSPADMETDICTSSPLTLSWTPAITGPIASEGFDVFFGTTSPPPFVANVATSSYNPGALTAGQTYYWSVEPKNAVGNATGCDIYSFTTANHAITGTTPASICGIGTADLGATASSGDINWYENATGGAPVGTGGTFTTPVLNTTTTYYASTSLGGSTFNTSKLAPEPASTGFNTQTYGQVFTADLPFTLNSLQVFSTTGTALTINLYNDNGTVLLQTTGSIPVVAGSSPIIPINFAIAPGTYRLSVNGMTGAFTRDNTGVSYPFALANGIGTMLGFHSSITGAVATTTSYYFLYNWNVSTGCESPRVPVTATVTAADIVTINPSTTTSCPGDQVTLQASSANTNYSYTWEPGNLSGASVNVNPTETTTYTVTGTDGVCTETEEVTITVNGAVLGTISDDQEICQGDDATISLSGSVGDIQWQSFDGSNWIDIIGETGTSVLVMPTVNTEYRAAVGFVGCPTIFTNAVTITVNDPQVVSTTGDAVCGAGDVTLQATPSAGATIEWFDVPTGGNSLGTGNFFTTNIVASTTFYAQANSGGGSATGGKITPNITDNTSGSNWGLVFDVVSPTTLQTVDVYPNNAGGGNITIVLQDNTGALIQNVGTFIYPAGNGTTPHTLNLNLPLPTGTGLRLIGQTMSGNLVREFAANNTFPYVSSDNNVTVTNGYINGLNTTYYWFYNWQLSSGCESPRVPVTATSTPADLISITPSTTTSCPGDLVNLAASSANANYVYTWEPGNLSGASVDVTPLVTTTYTVTGTDGVCTDIQDVTITVTGAELGTISDDASICLGDETTISLTGSVGNIQWQSYDGSNWNDIIGETGTSIDVTPNATTQYRAAVGFVGCPTIFTNAVTVTVNNPQVLSTEGDAICGPGEVTVSATPSAGATIEWFDAPTGGNSLGTGNTYTTNVAANTTFYAQASTGIVGANVGYPANNGGTAGAGTTNFGIVFDAHIPFTLEQVTVYPVSATSLAGTVTIDVIDENNNVLNTGTFNLVGSPGGLVPVVLDLNFDIAAGTNLKLRPGARTGITGLLFQPSAGAPAGNWGYPFEIPGIVTLNHSTLTAAPTNTPRLDLYYYFYDWVVSTGCESARTAVNVTTTICNTTQLRAIDCGATNVSMNQILRAIQVGAPNYRFRITGANNGGPGWNNDQFIYDTPNGQNHFRFQFIPGAVWGATYAVEVAVGDGAGNYGPYGNSCNVTLENQTTTQITAATCGATVTMDNFVVADWAPGAIGYRFRIQGANNGGAGWSGNTFIYETTAPVRSFKFNNHIPGALFGETYSIDVAVLSGDGNWLPYGSVCNVTIATPSTQIQTSQCGATGVALSTSVLADNVVGASGYRFRITGANSANWVNGQTILDRPNRVIQFQMVAGVLPGEIYQVEVAVMDANGNYGAYGSACNVTLAGTPSIVINDENEIFMADKSLVEVVFGANASHNPFTTEFGIQVLNANDTETINVVIYDMSGKLIERNAVNPMDIEAAKFGSNLASGMYMIEVRQGSNQAVIRQVKN